MFEFRILMCFVLAFGLYLVEIRGDYQGAPNILWQDANVTIFSKEKRTFEKDLYDSMQEHKEGVTTSVPGRIAVHFLNKAAGAVPIFGGFFQFLLSFADMLTTTSDWQASLSKTIVDVAERTMAQGRAADLYARIQSIQNSLSMVDSANKVMIAWDTRKDLDYMMNIFDASDSIFKKFPLMGAPILINLSKMIAQFSREINDPYISCKMRGLLIEYRNRTLEARLNEITLTIDADQSRYPHADGRIYKEYDMVFVRAHVMALKYSKTIRDEFSPSSRWTCKKTDIPNYSDKYYRYLSNFLHRDHKLVDKFGKTHTFPRNINCAAEYFTYVRHVIEEMFNIESFDNFCDGKDPRIPTDLGYLTIKIKNVGFGRFEEYRPTGIPPLDHKAAYSGSKVFVVIYINGQIAHTTKTIESCMHCDFNEIYHTGLIFKNSSIMVETRQGLFYRYSNIVDFAKRSIGTIDDYLRYGLRLGRQTHEEARTYIETTTIWKDEYKLSTIASMFLAVRTDEFLWNDQFFDKEFAKARAEELEMQKT